MTTLDAHLMHVATTFALGTPHTITPLQPGFVAHAHRLQSATHDVMVKTYDHSRAITARMLEYAPFYLQVTDYVYRHTPAHGRIAMPMARPDGTFLHDDAPYVSAVFAFLPGETPRTTPLTVAQQCDMATTVGYIHRASAQVPLPAHARIETFIPRWDAVWDGMLNDGWTQLPAPVQMMLAPHRARLHSLHQRLRHVGAYLQTHPLPMVLCHSDIHGWNVIVQGDRTWLIDFEGLVLAPAEQDLYCWYGDANWPTIYATYQQVVGGHTLNAQSLAFYQIKRFLEDIYEWVAELCDDHLADTLRDEYTVALRENLTYDEHMLNTTGHAV